jgi:SAM-dependent methyltransferase
MFKCVVCKNDVVNWPCTVCGFGPKVEMDISYFAPQIMGVTDGYDPRFFKELSKLESTNFWFLARNKMINYFIKRYTKENSNYFELGCGSGFVLAHIEKQNPKWQITASEYQPEGIPFASTRVSSKVKFAQIDGNQIPYRNEFDVVGAFDVIEHIENDLQVLAEIREALVPGGLLFINVPQHMFLWSRYDELGHHFRRYSRNELHSKIINSGFEVVKSVSFNFLLFPILLLSRFSKKNKSKSEIDVMSELKISPLQNSLLSFILKLEFFLIRLRLTPAFGGSRFLVAKKIDNYKI